jgi:phospholipid/cholesterol/gamma-HCH transport system substrate-binding protein
VKAIKELAEDFDKKSGALMADGRRTLADISRAVNNFDRNPSRVIFGGGSSSAPPPEQQQAPPRQAPNANAQQQASPRQAPAANAQQQRRAQ